MFYFLIIYHQLPNFNPIIKSTTQPRKHFNPTLASKNQQNNPKTQTLKLVKIPTQSEKQPNIQMNQNTSNDFPPTRFH